jgi:hypothetical protein
LSDLFATVSFQFLRISATSQAKWIDRLAVRKRWVPATRPIQSDTDGAGVTRMVAGVGRNQRRALVLIFGREKGRAAAGICVFARAARAVQTGHQFSPRKYCQIVGF